MFNHHDPDCPDFLERGLATIQEAHFSDIFCDCHRYAEPHLMENGTAIAWPAGWNVEQAQAWRIKNNLCKPS
jgi:hypothetical protein